MASDGCEEGGPRRAPRVLSVLATQGLVFAPGSVEGAEVPLQVLGLVVVREEVVLVDVVLVVVFVPLGDVLFVVLVVLVLRLLAAFLSGVVVVVRVSGVRRSVRLGPEDTAETSSVWIRGGGSVIGGGLERYSHFVGVGVVGQVGGLSGFWFLAALGLVSHPEVLDGQKDVKLRDKLSTFMI